MAFAFIFSLQGLALPIASAQDATPTPGTDSGPRFIIRPADGADGDYFTLKADAGTTNTLKVVLGNADDEDLELRTFVNDAAPMTNGGFSIADETVPATGVATWIDYPAETLTFKPGEGIERSFTVTIPADAKPGQYIAGLALQTAKPLEVEGTSMFNQIIRKTIAVFIIVPGPETPEFTLGDAQLLTDGAVPRIDIPVTNSGNVLVKPEGELTLTDASGKDVVKAPIAMGSVYAGTTAPLSVGLTTALPDGDYTLSVDLEDKTTGAKASIADATIAFSAAAQAPAQFVIDGTVELSPDTTNPAFANVDVTITNQGDPVGKAELLLEVKKDGELVETFSLAASLALPQGETTVSQRYIPPTGWESGEWTFSLQLNVIDESTDAATTVATLDTIPAIEVGK
jgi:hypothetical protein